MNLDKGFDRLELSIGKDFHPAIWKEIKCPKTPTIAERFIKSIRTGINSQPDFKRGAEAQKILDAAFISHAQRETG